jgi:hypothetical protein
MTAPPDTIATIGLILHAVTVLLAASSAYYIWRQLRAVVYSGQENLSERLASQSIEIIQLIASDSKLYGYFYSRKPLLDEEVIHSKVLCYAEIVANFLEHVFLQRDGLPTASREAWLRYVLDHYRSSKVVGDFVESHREWYASVFVDYVETSPSDAVHGMETVG